MRYFILAFLLLGFSSYAQGPGCPNVNAGEDIELDCEQSCTNISATFLQTGVTTSYDVSPIDYQPPFPTTGETEVSVFIDDKWSSIIPLPFDFCFYGGTYSEMLIGSNSVITFDTLNNQPDGWCEWLFSDSIPSTNLFNSTIFGRPVFYNQHSIAFKQNKPQTFKSMFIETKNVCKIAVFFYCCPQICITSLAHIVNKRPLASLLEFLSIHRKNGHQPVLH